MDHIAPAFLISRGKIYAAEQSKFAEFLAEFEKLGKQVPGFQCFAKDFEQMDFMLLGKRFRFRHVFTIVNAKSEISEIVSTTIADRGDENPTEVQRIRFDQYGNIWRFDKQKEYGEKVRSSGSLHNDAADIFLDLTFASLTAE